MAYFSLERSEKMELTVEIYTFGWKIGEVKFKLKKGADKNKAIETLEAALQSKVAHSLWLKEKVP